MLAEKYFFVVVWIWIQSLFLFSENKDIPGSFFPNFYGLHSIYVFNVILIQLKQCLLEKYHSYSESR